MHGCAFVLKKINEKLQRSWINKICWIFYGVCAGLCYSEKCICVTFLLLFNILMQFSQNAGSKVKMCLT